MKRRKLIRLFAGLLCGIMFFTGTGAEQLVYAAQKQTETPELNAVLESQGENEPSGETEENEEADGGQKTEEGKKEEGQEKEEETDSDKEESSEEEKENSSETGSEEMDSEEETKKDETDGELVENPENETDKEENKKGEEFLNAAGNIASGVIDEEYGHIEWAIDSEGTLTATGTGNYFWKTPWYDYREKIKKADVSIKGMTDISSMFRMCTELVSVDLSKLDTSQVTDMSDMFSGCTSLENVNMSGFDTSQVTDMSDMFSGCTNLEKVDVSGFDTSQVENMYGMFSRCQNLLKVDVSGFDTSHVTNMGSMFWGCASLMNLEIDKFNTNKVENMYDMFSGCKNLVNLDVSNFDTSQVTSMKNMFSDCTNLESVDVSKFNTSQVENMYGMFSGCKNLVNLDVSNFDTSHVTSMNRMFSGCQNLINLEVGGFNTSRVTNMGFMFSGCQSLINLDVSRFNTSRVTDMGSMFTLCRNLTSVDVSKFNTSQVTNMYSMFGGCSKLSALDVSRFDTKQVTDMANMFAFEDITRIDLRNFDMNQVTCAGSMFSACKKLTLIQSPYNVKTSIELPTYGTWYLSDGTVVTELPQNLSHSVAIGRDFIPEDPEPVDDGKTAYKQYVVAVYNEKSKLPVSGVSVVGNNCCYTTNQNGKITVTAPSGKLAGVRFTRQNYKTKTLDLTLESDKENVVYLSPDMAFSITPPDLSIKAPLKSDINVGGNKLTWLDMEFKLEAFKWKDDRGISSKIPFKTEYDAEKNTVKITFGIEDTDESGAVNKASYENMKNLCNSIGNSKSGKEVQKLLGKNMTTDGTMSGIKIKSSIMGYLELEADSHRVIESGAIVAMKGSGEITYRPSSTFGAVYVKATLELSTQGKLIVHYNDESIAFSAEVEFGQKLGLAGGIGTKNLHAEVGAEGEFKDKITMPYKKKSSFNITFTGTVYAEVKCFILSAKPKYKFTELQLWPLSSNDSSVVWSNGYSTIDSYKLVSRDYEMASYRRTRGGLGLDADNIYPDGAPEMVQLADGTVLAVWIADLGEKSDENRTTLVYSVQTKGRWSSPKSVCESGRADFEPVLVADGNKAYLAWTNLDHELEADFSAEEMLAATDVYFAVYENGTFGEPVLLSEKGNGRFETFVDIAAEGNKQMIVWAENSENDAFLSSGRNSIYARICIDGVWGEKQCLADSLNPITSMAVSGVSGTPFVAYTMDMDGDSETSGDVEVFLIRNGEIKRITSDQRNDKEVFFLKDKLYWSADGEIMQTGASGEGNAVSTGVDSGLGYKVLENNGKRAILTKNAEGYDSVLYLSTESNTGFSRAVPVTDTGKKISDYAAIYQGGGAVEAIVFETDVLENPTEDAVYGDTNLRTYEKLEAASLAVDDIYIDEESVAGAVVPVELILYNGASRDLNSVRISMKGNDAVLVDDITVPCQIGAGESGTVTVECPYQVSSEIMTLETEVLPGDYEDMDLSDNIIQTEMGSCDLALQDTEITLQEDGTAQLQGKITNTGKVSAQNVQIRLLAGGYEGEEIFSNSYGTLAAGAEGTVSCTIPASCLNFESAADGKYIYYSCNTDTKESRYDNNTGNLVVFPRKVTDIVLEEETMTLPVKTRGSLHASVIPENAFDKNISYTSDNTMVAVTDENGTITAVGAGTATITVMAEDGGCARICVVTVTEAEGEKKIYGLDQNSLSLKKEETGQLTVTDTEGNAPSGTLKWESSDEKIAVVDETGLVTGMAAGTANIMVSLGEEYYDSCVVKVTDEEIQAVLLDENMITMTEGESQTLVVSFMPENTTSDKTFTFRSSDETVVTVNTEGIVTAVAGGSAQITVTSVNGKEAVCQVYVESLPRYEVIFDSGLGDEVQTVEGILYGETIALPQIAERPGYHFEGWYTKQEGAGEAFTEATAVTEDLIVYAYWTRVQSNETSGFYVEPIGEQIYTGTQIKPAVTVMDGGRLLKQGTDYTIGYKNNIKVGAAQVTIKGKGNYTKSIVTEFQIVPKDLGAEEIILSAEDLKMGKTGTIVKPKVTVKDGKKKLTAGKEYTISFQEQKYGDEIAGQELTVTVTGTGNYTGTAETTFHVYKQGVSGFVIDSIKNQSYTGNAVEPQITVYASKQEQKAGNPLTEGEDYTISYSDNKKVGNAKVIIAGEGIYGGTRTFGFKIVSKKLDNSDAEQEDQNILVELVQDSLIYTGSSLKPEVKVTFGEKVLTEGKDYTVSYQNNTNVPAKGAAEGKRPCVIVKGKGSYTGSIRKYFNITPKLLDEGNGISVTIQDVKVKKEDAIVRPKVTVKDGKKSLKEGKDYQVDYGEWSLAKEREGDIPEVKITGKDGGNYAYAESGEGVIHKYFHIYTAASDITQCTVNLSPGQDGQRVENGEIVATYNGTGIKPTVTVQDGEEELTEGKDYSITYKNNVNVPKIGVKESGKPQVIVKGKGRFTGSIIKTFDIEPLDLSQSEELTTTVKDVKYTGKALKPAVTAKIGKSTLKSGRDFTLTYENNVQRAEKDAVNAPQVVLQGKGNYAGKVTVPFRIYAKDISKTLVDKIPSQIYTGEAIEPEVMVRVDKKDQTGLTEESYTVTYQKNIKVGTGEAVITGRGEYGGTKVVKFVILPKWLAWLKK